MFNWINTLIIRSSKIKYKIQKNLTLFSSSSQMANMQSGNNTPVNIKITIENPSTPKVKVIFK